MTTVGDILDEWDFHVERGKIREFGRAVQDCHWNDSNIAPPTFLVVASSEFVERLITSLLGLDRSRTVHGEQHYEYFEPIVAGDTLHCSARTIADERKIGKRGGAMRLVTTGVEFVSASTGRLVCRETMLSIEKEASES